MKRRILFAVCVLVLLFSVPAFARTPGFQLERERYVPGEEIIVRYSNAPTTSGIWMALHKVGTPNTQYVAWTYLRGNASGMWSVVAPDEVGMYEFRLYGDMGYGQVIASSRPIAVGNVQPVKDVSEEIRRLQQLAQGIFRQIERTEAELRTLKDLAFQLEQEIQGILRSLESGGPSVTGNVGQPVR